MYNKKSKKIFRSMAEFKRTYFPKSFEIETSQEPANAHEVGIRLAKESLDKVREQLRD